MSDPGNEAWEDDETGADGNRIVGAVPRDVLEYLARSLVDEPDAVVVEVDEGRRSVMFRLHVAPGDMGRVIGRRGRVAQSIRAVVRAAGALEGVDAQVDIVD
ncbi:MAG: KH domain-containing protein [Acidimicrobiales bacterium]